MQLRPYQEELNNEIDVAYMLGAGNVLATLDCGGGKTAIFAYRMARCEHACVAIAHREELVSQMSLTLAKYGVKHRIIGPVNVIRAIIQLHVMVFGKDYYDAGSKRAVAGVDTLISWSKPTSPHYYSLMKWAPQVREWTCDEAHHLLAGNKWGKAVALFPNARGLGVTATAERTDGCGLGRHADGVFDAMVEGKRGRWLINNGYLTEYRVVCPPSDLRLSDVKLGADGDYIRKQLSERTKRSSIMGDVITQYLRWTPGKLGVTFAPDVDTATEFAARFNSAGVPAEVVSAKTPHRTRVDILRRFARREILELVNVDLFGEGFDLPAIEVVSMARATESYTLYHQQFMRTLRLLEGKDRGWVIDHVGNVAKHRLPDSPRVYTLDRKERRSSAKQEGAIPMKVCLNPTCMSPYEAVHPCCPFCGYVPVPVSRSGPEFVDGDLHELDEATLAAMRGEVQLVDRTRDEVLQQYAHMGSTIAYTQAKRHGEKQQAQSQLRDALAWYGGHQRAMGRTDRMGWRAFYHTFGIDVLSAQALGRAEAEALTERVNNHLGR